jgi:hypothetical protein
MYEQSEIIAAYGPSRQNNAFCELARALTENQGLKIGR